MPFWTWSEDHIARFEAKHVIGSKPRLALALLLYIGLRRSDVVKIGPQHIHDGVLTIEQGKTEGGEEAHLEIPVHPKLRQNIDATPTLGMKSFLVTHFGKPYSAPGFGNWFREQCNAAGYSDVSAHGLRKATARRLAEIGCTAHQIAAITGHASLSEVQRYTRAADRKRMAREAMTEVGGGRMVNKFCPTLVPGWTIFGASHCEYDAGVEHGGPGRTRTSNQTVMSEPRDREKACKS